jgi:TatD DNase family protein
MIDSHCHLADEAFVPDLDAVLARAQDAGVTAALCILSAGDEEEAGRARAVRDCWSGIAFATGVHPHQAAAFDGRPDDAAKVAREHAARFGARAIGEIGLDYHYDFSPPAIQREVFAVQVALALELDRPVIIHTREATDDTFGILREAGKGVLRGVFHCFTGDDDMGHRALDLGFHVSFAGIVTFPKAEALRQASRSIPSDRLLIETDSPYLAPIPFRGKRNEPAYVGRVLDTLADVRNESRLELDAGTTRNFERLFALSGGRVDV